MRRDPPPCVLRESARARLECQWYAEQAAGHRSTGYNGIAFQPTYSASTNRFTAIPGASVSYDATGNLTADGSHTYTWNADGRPLTVDSVNITYDALGRVVEQARGTTYIEFAYDPTGRMAQAMTGQVGGTAIVALPGGGKALYASQLLFRHPDWLGTSRLTTTLNRTVYYDGAYAPFGENYAGSGTTDLDFTGQIQNTVTGLYDFPFREYSPVQSRWASPDPAGLAAVNPANPQSWNRYAYISNNPTAAIDPLGLFGSDAIQYLRAMAHTAAFFSGFEFFPVTSGRYYWNDGWHPEMIGIVSGVGITSGGGAANNGKSICSSANGKTIPVNSPSGQLRFQFNGQGNLVGFGLQLTGMNGVQGSGFSIPANTFVGATQLSPGTVQFGLSNPVNVGSGFSRAYFQTATFSGGSFTSVQGAYAPLGIPLGSTSGNSSLLQSFLNGNSSTASQAQNFGNLLTSVASLVSSNVSCQNVFGGG